MPIKAIVTSTVRLAMEHGNRRDRSSQAVTRPWRERKLDKRATGRLLSRSNYSPGHPSSRSKTKYFTRIGNEIFRRPYLVGLLGVLALDGCGGPTINGIGRSIALTAKTTVVASGQTVPLSLTSTGIPSSSIVLSLQCASKQCGTLSAESY